MNFTGRVMDVRSPLDIQAAPTYNPSKLLDAVKIRLVLKNDAELGRFLNVNGPLLSKMRSGHARVNAAFLIRLHEASGLQISELLALIGDRRQKYRV